MKKVLVFLLASAMALTLASCNETVPETSAIPGSGSVQIANPFEECSNLDEAAEIAGFTLSAPENVPNWVENLQIRAMKDEMIELVYTGGEKELRIRKGAGSEDISGDYTVYDETEEKDVDGRSVIMQGNEQGQFVAIWTQGDYTYAVTFSERVTTENMELLIGSIE